MGLVVNRHDMKRRAPTEFRDEAELFARQYSGHGDVVWVGAPVNCWQVRLTLAPNDPRLRHPDDGTHFESAELHEWVDPSREPSHPKLDKLPRNARTNAVTPGYIPLELDEIGVSGLRKLLEKGSLMSGRGEYESSEAATKAVVSQHRMLRETTEADQRDNARQRMKYGRRRALGIPMIPVGIDLTGG